MFYNPYGNPENPFGSAESVYDFISCWRAPGGHLGNTRESYLTFFSPGSYLHEVNVFVSIFFLFLRILVDYRLMCFKIVQLLALK